MIAKIAEIANIFSFLSAEPWTESNYQTRAHQLSQAFSELAADQTEGTAVLVAGTVVVPAAVTANSLIHLTTNIPGGTPGWLQVSARVPGTSFTILSSSGADTSTVAWEFSEP